MAVKRYDGSAWQTVAGLGAQGAAATSSTITTWVKTAAGGETSLSGNDDNSQSLSYTIGQELVFINGVLQKRGADYTANTGTSITGLAALTASDVVTVWSNNAFSVSNAISNTIVDAKGDLLTATSADVPARLAVGSNGQFLTADSTTGTGLKWATAGAGGNLAQIATGTLSGASVTISGLSSYNDLILFMDGYTNSTANGYPLVRINNNNTSNYRHYGIYYDASSWQPYNSNLDNIYLGTDPIDRTNTAQVSNLKLTNCKTAGFTDWDSNNRSYTGTNRAFLYKGVYTVSEAVSSLVILNNGGNWAGGTYYLYGA